MTRSFPTLALLLLAGCVQTRATMLEPKTHRPPVCPEGVTLFTARNRVPSEYVEVAILYSNGDTRQTSQDDMIQSQRKKAAKLGANGMIIGRINEPDGFTQVAGALTNTPTERYGRALAIWIPADSITTDMVCTQLPAATRH